MRRRLAHGFQNTVCTVLTAQADDVDQCTRPKSHRALPDQDIDEDLTARLDHFSSNLWA